jgi:hypothetical protein
VVIYLLCIIYINCSLRILDCKCELCVTVFTSVIRLPLSIYVQFLIGSVNAVGSVSRLTIFGGTAAKGLETGHVNICGID